MMEAKKKINDWCEALSEKVKLAGIPGGTTEKITALAEDARERQLVVPVVGEFSAGKSSMINSLLGENVLTEDIRPETALATELHYSPNAFIEAVKSDGKIDKYKIEDIDKVKEKAEAEEYQYARVYLNNSRLREIEPLVLVDMPGFSSPPKQHNKAIAAYLDRGCYYIVLSSSTEEGAISDSLKRRLKEIEGWGREFTFFLSKANLRHKDDIDELITYYQKQLEDGFESPAKVTPLENNSGDKVLQCLKNININRVFGSIYRGTLLDVCDDIITAINLQVNASRKDAAKNMEAIREMKESKEKLRKKAAAEQEEMKRRYSGAFLTDVLADVGRALDNSIDELTGLAASGNQGGIERTLNDIVRSALTVSLKDKMEGLTNEISVDLSESLRGLDKVMKDLDLNTNFMQDMAGKVGNALQGELLSKLPGGKDALNMGFKALAGAGLAATVINPIIGIIIVFLPDLISAFMKLFGGDSKDSQREKIRSELTGRVFPEIKRNLRAEISKNLDAQLDAIIKGVGEKLDEQIKQQEEIIEAQVAEKNESKEAIEAKQKQLEAIRDDVKRIRSEILDGGNDA